MRLSVYIFPSTHTMYSYPNRTTKSFEISNFSIRFLRVSRISLFIIQRFLKSFAKLIVRINIDSFRIDFVFSHPLFSPLFFLAANYQTSS